MQNVQRVHLLAAALGGPGIDDVGAGGFAPTIGPLFADIGGGGFDPFDFSPGGGGGPAFLTPGGGAGAAFFLDFFFFPFFPFFKGFLDPLANSFKLLSFCFWCCTSSASACKNAALVSSSIAFNLSSRACFLASSSLALLAFMDLKNSFFRSASDKFDRLERSMDGGGGAEEFPGG